MRALTLPFRWLFGREPLRWYRMVWLELARGIPLCIVAAILASPLLVGVIVALGLVIGHKVYTDGMPAADAEPQELPQPLAGRFGLVAVVATSFAAAILGFVLIDSAFRWAGDSGNIAGSAAAPFGILGTGFVWRAWRVRSFERRRGVEVWSAPGQSPVVTLRAGSEGRSASTSQPEPGAD